jgi:glyoxylase-like metal-dependent hydrolase (beta-lactamase superfamily II)
LKAAVEATGNKLEDIKKILIGHLHLDHAGGLDMFLDRKDVEIWVHDKELRSAFWSVATGADVGVSLKLLPYDGVLIDMNRSTLSIISSLACECFDMVMQST